MDSLQQRCEYAVLCFYRFKSYADDVNIGFQMENFGRASASSVNLQLALRESRSQQGGFSTVSLNNAQIPQGDDGS